MKKECKDHLGNIYSSVIDMLNFYHIPKSVYLFRKKSGWNLEKILTTPVRPMSKERKDHLGNEFDSVFEMCEFYGISKANYINRKAKGWSLEKILTTSVQQHNKECKDHQGNSFNSITEMCEFYGISKTNYDSRIKSGWSLEKSLTTPVREVLKVYDHLGNEFNSVSEMCEFYGISRNSYDGRIESGWSLEKILTTPVRPISKECKDHLGNEFDSISEMCEFYGITFKRFNGRISLGWSLEESLTIPRNMYIGEYRVAEILKKLNIKFYHDCTIKKIFSDLHINVDWNEFLLAFQNNLEKAGLKWSKSKIEKLRPDFVLYTDNNNQIQGVIEFDGEQHQNFVEYFFRTIETFYNRINADVIKQSLWEYLNIPMLRIRHDQIEKIESMVIDFINNPQDYIHNHNTYLSEEEYWSILEKEKTKLDLVFTE